jgi:hypothetical protein
MSDNKSRRYIWFLIPAIMSFLLLAAHFSRQEMNLVAVLVLILPSLLLVKKKLILTLFQLFLFLGVLEWIRSLMMYIDERQITGEDYGTLTIIISAVAFFTFISAVLLSAGKVRFAYRN